MMFKECKECPWIIKNTNNNIFINHSKKYNKSHNCHMLTKNVWKVEDNIKCKGRTKYENKKNVI